jgi:hypothetical protein
MTGLRESGHRPTYPERRVGCAHSDNHRTRFNLLRNRHCDRPPSNETRTYRGRRISVSGRQRPTSINQAQVGRPIIAATSGVSGSARAWVVSSGTIQYRTSPNPSPEHRQTPDRGHSVSMARGIPCRPLPAGILDRQLGNGGAPIRDTISGSRGLLSLLERVTAGRRALRSPPPVLLRRRELERWSRRASGPSCRSRRPMPRHFRTL